MAISDKTRAANQRELLPDHANDTDDRSLPINRVGIKDLSYPIQVLDRSQKVQSTVAEIGLYVGLPQHFKGTHMSRFVEILNAVRGEMTIRRLPEVLSEVQRRLEAEDAFADIRFPYFISKRAPISGAESLMKYDCSFLASRRGEHTDFVLGVGVPVQSLCPCSKAISEYGAHNQRSIVHAEVRSQDFIWIEDVVEVIEGCGSSPLYALLKREDEKHVTEAAYDNPKFVEDIVRDAILCLRELPGVRWLKVSAENCESIHNHSAFAEIEWAEGDEHDPMPMVELAAGTAMDAPKAFGAWLRSKRVERQFSQQDLAGRLNVSASYLSRVENGEKRLSTESLDALARLLGIEADMLLLRAGVVPERLVEAISAQPGAFLDWIRSRE